jgi:hypothetical protein
MTPSLKYPDTFFRVASTILERHPEVRHQWSFDEKKQNRKLIIPKVEDSGFDVGVNCETYGLYPWAGDWSGPCWDINTPKTTLEEMSEEVLALLRILLSPESRLGILYRGNRKSKLILEFATPTGWHVHDKHGVNFLAWFGEKKTKVCQNSHLLRRANFDGTDPLWFQHYRWTD